MPDRAVLRLNIVSENPPSVTLTSRARHITAIGVSSDDLLAALILYPIVWLILLPFRIVGIAVEGVLELVKGIIFLPGRLLRTSKA